MSYFLVSSACGAVGTSVRIIIAGISVLAGALILAGVALARPRAGRSTERIDDDAADPGSAVFMRRLALLEGALFLIAVIFTAAPAMVLKVCS